MKELEFVLILIEKTDRNRFVLVIFEKTEKTINPGYIYIYRYMNSRNMVVVQISPVIDFL